MIQSDPNQYNSGELSKAKYKKELARDMGLSMRTFQRRLKEAGIEIQRGLIAPDVQESILKKLGWHDLA